MTSKTKSKKVSAGLLIIFDNKILLAHPTNSPWRNAYTIPKGKVEKGESLKDTAIRETFEEVGILIKKEEIKSEPFKINYVNEEGICYKEVFYFIIHIDKEFTTFKLQKSEVDWCGFLNKDEATDKIFWRFAEMLKYIN